MNLLNAVFSANLLKAVSEIPNYMVVVIGLGTVFTGLICIVFICKLLGYFCNISAKTTDSASDNSTPVQSTPVKAVIENRGEVVAAVSAAIAEELGTDVSGIRIVSIKKA